MTTDILTELEEATLHQLENDIRVSFWVMVDRMETIERERLYRANHTTFSDWLLKRFPQLTANGKGIRETTWRQWKASAKVYNLAKTNGVELSNEYAARALRQVEDSLRVLVINKAVVYHEMKTGDTPEQLTAAMIKPVVQEVKAVIDEAAQTGHVDTGDGSMSAFDAAIDARLFERDMRSKQHAADGAKRGGWSEPISFDDWEIKRIADPFKTNQVEIRWRFIEEPCPEGEPDE